MKYKVKVVFLDGVIHNLEASKKPYIIENRIHIDHSSTDYSVILLSQIKMYTVEIESN